MEDEAFKSMAQNMDKYKTVGIKEFYFLSFFLFYRSIASESCFLLVVFIKSYTPPAVINTIIFRTTVMVPLLIVDYSQTSNTTKFKSKAKS